MTAAKPLRGFQQFSDTFVIYKSMPDRCWIAHSLRTDQVGVGDGVIDALVDGMRALDQLITLAQQEKDIAVLRDPPPYIRDMARHAEELPEELHAIACKKLYGKWSKYVSVTAKPIVSCCFKAFYRGPVHE